ncbi:hypothetical protein [Streptomyces chartreusis]|uniref:hypothetical protein n=1 Tax=Streptomyces chartreusis TaxID=1969 RepID=UPI00362807EB
MFFLDVPTGSGFTGGEPSRASVIEATHRAGRPLETRQKILSDISRAWSDITGQAEHDLMVSITEVDARSAMEGGFVLPVPGQEAHCQERPLRHDLRS